MKRTKVLATSQPMKVVKVTRQPMKVLKVKKKSLTGNNYASKYTQD